jgi:hypothetical protein
MGREVRRMCARALRRMSAALVLIVFDNVAECGGGFVLVGCPAPDVFGAGHNPT